ncbi:tRNA lysidine(34) synthetase TilS [Adlercreutzia muris]|uniref:tRNA lysidine(34) synthetase TilS n=1 Tax=Adlercreutzia muris TaxID=1796610 RepID=UPI0013656451|nr:tRNA lysidine(34) synthetase TilS [Adlercreutzia muris]MCI8306034.1 tRNA lysidine(34) synthetase TilS [Enterorhabdus sp.]NCA31315.1 tRNA lysidine(34) synthetase TilS [Adlercreutzia muris]
MTDCLEKTLEKARATIAARDLAASDAAVLLMVSGGSDSTALAYLGAALRDAGDIGPVAMLHVNHQLRGEEADGDERFVSSLAELLHIPLFICSIDIAAEAARSHENVEAVARRERYLAANEALRSMCQHEGCPLSEARIFTAHTADDRIENFYMRSIVGTGPGGFRSMRYENGPVVRPLLDATRDELRAFLAAREAADEPCACDAAGNLWREDATNAHTDRFRAYVRHKVVPPAKEWNEALPEVLVRSMNLIADEDDMLEAMAGELAQRESEWVAEDDTFGIDRSEGFRLRPAFGAAARPLQRRAVLQLLQAMLGPDARVDTASVEAVLNGFAEGKPHGGYVANIQHDLAVSANKQGVLVEPMAYFRARRKRDKEKAGERAVAPRSPETAS